MSWKDDWPAWAGIGAGASAVLALIRGYLRHPVLLPASQVEELRQSLTDCHGECRELRIRLVDSQAQMAAVQNRLDKALARIDELIEELDRMRERLWKAQRDLAARNE